MKCVHPLPTHLIMVSEMVETLMLLEVYVVQVLMNPCGVRPEKVPFVLALGFDPVHVFEHVKDCIVQRASETYCSVCHA